MEAVTKIRMHAAKKGSGAILHMATGAGKTACFADVLKGAHAKGKCAIMVVKGKALVHQASDRLRREGVPHGIYQGGNSRNTHERILVCSIDTMYARRTAPAAELVVIDECHMAHSDGYYWFLEQYPNAFKLGVSATPHHKKGMTHIGDTIVCPIKINELIAQGYLVGGKYFIPYIPDLHGIKKTQGDFNTNELSKRSSGDEELTANAAKVWDNNLRGKSTICYAVSVIHAGILKAGLQAVGAKVEIITATTKDHERKRIIAELESGAIDIIASVGVLTTGVDIPSLRAILCCRPTESYNLWVQILGRGTRPYPGKEYFLVYDLSGNLRRHGPIEAERPASLTGIPDEIKISTKTCQECYAVNDADQTECIACGASLATVRVRESGKRVHGLTDNDEIKEYTIEPWELHLPFLVEKAKEKGMRKGWIYHTMKSKFGDEIADRSWPRIRSLKKWPLVARKQS